MLLTRVLKLLVWLEDRLAGKLPIAKLDWATESASSHSGVSSARPMETSTDGE